VLEIFRIFPVLTGVWSVYANVSEHTGPSSYLPVKMAPCSETGAY
jgi:hypothetical protein